MMIASLFAAAAFILDTATTENPREVDRILADYVHPNPFDPGACTRGLYLRGVE